jgi:hypothetical protein
VNDSVNHRAIVPDFALPSSFDPDSTKLCYSNNKGFFEGGVVGRKQVD